MDNEIFLNIASQCKATACSDFAAQVTVDAGSGTLTELLLEAAAAIEILVDQADILKENMRNMSGF